MCQSIVEGERHESANQAQDAPCRTGRGKGTDPGVLSFGARFACDLSLVLFQFKT
jgi:hypothetical protein